MQRNSVYQRLTASPIRTVSTVSTDAPGSGTHEELAQVLLDFARDAWEAADSIPSGDSIGSSSRVSPEPVSAPSAGQEHTPKRLEMPEVTSKTRARTLRKQRPVNVVSGTAILFDPSKHHPAACETISQQTQYRRGPITAQLRDGKYVKSDPPHSDTQQYPVVTITRQEFQRKAPSSAASSLPYNLPRCFDAATHHPAKTGNCVLRHSAFSNVVSVSPSPLKRTAEEPALAAAKRQKLAITKAAQPERPMLGASVKNPKQYNVLAGTKIRFDPASHHPALLETLSPQRFTRREPVSIIKGTALEFDPAKHNPIFVKVETTTRGQFDGWKRTLRLRDAGRVARAVQLPEPSPVAATNTDPAISHPAFNLPATPTPRSRAPKPYDVVVFSL